MGNQAWQAPNPDPSWPLEELRDWNRLSTDAKIVTRQLNVKPSEYFKQLEREKAEREAEGR